MKVKSQTQLIELQRLIGPRTAEDGKNLLNNGGEIWVFLSEDEVDGDRDLNNAEKLICKLRFCETNGKYAVWSRPPLCSIAWRATYSSGGGCSH